MAINLTKLASSQQGPSSAFEQAIQNGHTAPTRATDVVNLSSLDFLTKRQRPMWPVGIYDARVKDCQYVQSKSGALNWNFKIVLEVFNQEGSTQTQYHYLGFRLADGVTLVPEDALIRLGKTILCISPDFDMAAVSEDTVPEGLIDRPCRIKLKIGEPYNGERRNEISEVLPASQGF